MRPHRPKTKRLRETRRRRRTPLKYRSLLAGQGREGQEDKAYGGELGPEDDERRRRSRTLRPGRSISLKKKKRVEEKGHQSEDSDEARVYSDLDLEDPFSPKSQIRSQIKKRKKKKKKVEVETETEEKKI